MIAAACAGFVCVPAGSARIPAQAEGCPAAAGHGWQLAPAPAGLTAGDRGGWEATAPILAEDPLNPNQLYASVDGTGVQRSLDGGCTWRTVFQLSDIRSTDPTSPYAVTATEYQIMGVMTPRGITAADAKTVYALAEMSATDSATFYSTPILVAVSHDGGSTWTVPSPSATSELPVGAPECAYFGMSWLVPAPSAPDTAYFACDNSYYGVHDGQLHDSGGAFYVTHDAGATWAVQSTTMPYINYNGGRGPQFDVDRFDSRVVYGATPATVAGKLGTAFITSTDAGAHWQTRSGGPSWDQVTLGLTTMRSSPATPTHLAAYYRNNVCYSLDAGRTTTCWKPPMLGQSLGLPTAATWSPDGTRLFVIVAYDLDTGTTYCGEPRVGVLTVKGHKWRLLPDVPSLAKTSNGSEIGRFITDPKADHPLMLAQPCTRTSNASWTLGAAPVDLTRFTGRW